MILALVFKFLSKFKIVKRRSPEFVRDAEQFNLHDLFTHRDSNFLVTTSSNSKGLQCRQGLVVELPEILIKNALAYYFKKSTL